MAISIPVAYLFYRLVERPAMRWSANLKPSHGARVAPPAPERIA